MQGVEQCPSVLRYSITRSVEGALTVAYPYLRSRQKRSYTEEAARKQISHLMGARLEFKVVGCAFLNEIEMWVPKILHLRRDFALRRLAVSCGLD